jgi:uncharacterized protein YbaR (Trm112 family)
VLDVLVCPNDKQWPLKLHIFQSRKHEDARLPGKYQLTNLVCKFYCSKMDKMLVIEKENGELELQEDAKQIDYESDCKECIETEIIAGMIECKSCKNLYPIVDEIPMVLTSELRNQDIEKQFTEKWAEKIKEILPK